MAFRIAPLKARGIISEVGLSCRNSQEGRVFEPRLTGEGVPDVLYSVCGLWNDILK